MAGKQLVSHWNEWVLQVLVLLSFTLQVMLLISGELRRSMDSGVLRAFVWASYQMADSTAIYVLGHLSVTSRSADHQLMALWAPFLLLHLGGQDSITAYAIEDNQLWLRHLQTFAVQVAAAAYVLYESSILGSRSLLQGATVLMFVVGVVKYGDRVWALRRAGSTPSGYNYQGFSKYVNVASPVLHTITGPQDKEALVFVAHAQLDIPKDLLNGPLTGSAVRRIGGSRHWGDWVGGMEEVYKVVEIQLSLMHDVLYTKAEVMRTWYGLCIRLFSPLATAGALLLFHHLSDHHGSRYNIVDVFITYVLLVGAVILETMSLLRAVFSSWTTYANLFSTWKTFRHFTEGEKKRKSLGDWLLSTGFVDVVMSLRRLVRAEDWTRRCSWSRSMGQHSLLQLCACSRASRSSRIARWMGFEDPWNMLVYSWSIPVSPFIVQLLVKHVKTWRPDHLIVGSQGQDALKRWRLYDELGWSVEESILVWHIATGVYLCWYQEQEKVEVQQRAELAKAVETLSNYMLFLLAARPYMLPPPANRNVYVEMSYCLTAPSVEYRSVEDLVRQLRYFASHYMNAIEIGDDGRVLCDYKILETAVRLGAKIISEESSTGHMLDLIAQVWAEMLCYVGHRCRAYSHAKQLATGSELITIAALLIEHLKMGAISDVAGY